MSGRIFMWAGILGTYLWLVVLTGRYLRSRIIARLCESCALRRWSVAVEDEGDLWWLCRGCAEVWTMAP